MKNILVYHCQLLKIWDLQSVQGGNWGEWGELGDWGDGVRS